MSCSPPIAAVRVAENLLAAADWGAAGRADRVGGAEVLVWLLVIGGIITAVCVAIRIVSRLQHRRRYNSHGSLFWGLCRIHGLDHRARRLLKQVAQHHRLPQPGRLFTEPGWLNPARLPASLRSRAAEVVALRNRLFA